MIRNPGLNIALIPWFHARSRGKRTAFVCGERRVAWAEFDRRVNMVANGLIASGMKKGDRVCFLALNSIETLEIMYGTLRAGGVVVPLSALLKPDMIASIANDSKAKYLFVVAPLNVLTAAVMDKLESIPKGHLFAIGFGGGEWTPYEEFMAGASDNDVYVDIDNEDECVILYTSGTTGIPKGIVHTFLGRTLLGMASAVEFRINSSSTLVINTPLFTNATWAMLLGSVMVGAVSVLLPLFAPEAFFESVQNEKATHTFLVPTQYHTILEHPDFARYDLSSLKVMVSMGSALPLPWKRQILEKLGPGLFELYGLTEGIATVLKPEDIVEKTGSVGTSMAGNDILILDDEGKVLATGETGEIAGFSPGMMKGYLNRPEATSDIVWIDHLGRNYIRSGDIGRLDEDGFLYILDRKRDMIVSGGVNVFASDIESVFLTHPDVSEVSVIAVPHEKWVETPLAIVITKPGSAVNEDELKQWCNARLAKYQRASAVEFRQEPFPRNVLGKVLKKELRVPYWKDK